MSLRINSVCVYVQVNYGSHFCMGAILRAPSDTERRIHYASTKYASKNIWKHLKQIEREKALHTDLFANVFEEAVLWNLNLVLFLRMLLDAYLNTTRCESKIMRAPNASKNVFKHSGVLQRKKCLFRSIYFCKVRKASDFFNIRQSDPLTRPRFCAPLPTQ